MTNQTEEKKFSLGRALVIGAGAAVATAAAVGGLLYMQAKRAMMREAEAYDEDGDDAEGVIEINGESETSEVTACDTDGDGKIDTVCADTNGDGKIDTVLTDTTGDGVLDTAIVDSDHDGQFDTVAPVKPEE